MWQDRVPGLRNGLFPRRKASVAPQAPSFQMPPPDNYLSAPPQGRRRATTAKLRLDFLSDAPAEPALAVPPDVAAPAPEVATHPILAEAEDSPLTRRELQRLLFQAEERIFTRLQQSILAQDLVPHEAFADDLERMRGILDGQQLALKELRAELELLDRRQAGDRQGLQEELGAALELVSEATDRVDAMLRGHFGNLEGRLAPVVRTLASHREEILSHRQQLAVLRQGHERLAAGEPGGQSLQAITEAQSCLEQRVNTLVRLVGQLHEGLTKQAEHACAMAERLERTHEGLSASKGAQRQQAPQRNPGRPWWRW